MITKVTEQMHLDQVEMQFTKDQVYTSLAFFFPSCVAHPAPFRGYNVLPSLRLNLSQVPSLLIDLCVYAFSHSNL